MIGKTGVVANDGFAGGKVLGLEIFPVRRQNEPDPVAFVARRRAFRSAVSVSAVWPGSATAMWILPF